MLSWVKRWSERVGEDGAIMAVVGIVVVGVSLKVLVGVLLDRCDGGGVDGDGV